MATEVSTLYLRPRGLNLAGRIHFKHLPPFRVSTDTLSLWPSAEEPNFLHEPVCQGHPGRAVPSPEQDDAPA